VKRKSMKKSSMKKSSMKKSSMKRKSIWLRVGIVCLEHTGSETNKAEDETGAAKGDGALSENTKGLRRLKPSASV
jgi:hypothetical protein